MRDVARFLNCAVVFETLDEENTTITGLLQERLERIPVLGLPFNPAFSEAVGTQPVSEPEHDHVVVREILRGYRLNGRVARASRVVVGQYDEQAATADSGATATADEGEDDLIGADENPAAPEAHSPEDDENPE